MTPVIWGSSVSLSTGVLAGGRSWQPVPGRVALGVRPPRGRTTTSGFDGICGLCSCEGAAEGAACVAVDVAGDSDSARRSVGRPPRSSNAHATARGACRARTAATSSRSGNPAGSESNNATADPDLEPDRPWASRTRITSSDRARRASASLGDSAPPAESHRTTLGRLPDAGCRSRDDAMIRV